MARNAAFNRQDPGNKTSRQGSSASEDTDPQRTGSHRPSPDALPPAPGLSPSRASAPNPPGCRGPALSRAGAGLERAGHPVPEPRGGPPEWQIVPHGHSLPNVSSPTPASSPSLTERRKAATRMEIARAAAGLFVKRGLKATRAEDIAQAAGIAPRTFYRYFATKEEAVAPSTRPAPPAGRKQSARPRPTSLCPGLWNTRPSTPSPPAPQSQQPPGIGSAPWSAWPSQAPRSERYGRRSATSRRRHWRKYLPRGRRPPAPTTTLPNALPPPSTSQPQWPPPRYEWP